MGLAHVAEEEGDVAAVLALGDEGHGLVEEGARARRQRRAPHQHLLPNHTLTACTFTGTLRALRARAPHAHLPRCVPAHHTALQMRVWSACA